MSVSPENNYVGMRCTCVFVCMCLHICACHVVGLCVRVLVAVHICTFMCVFAGVSTCECYKISTSPW